MPFQINKEKFLFLDGAMGTMLQKSGLPLGERPELLCISDPQAITDIHKMYIDAGSDIVYSNTFGANELKLEGTGYSTEEVIDSAVKCAKKATEGTSSYVALDIGPLGELLEPTGTLTFERAYECYRRMVVQGEKSGADLVVLETMTDLYEVKAAVLAVKENTSLPLMVSMTFEQNGRTFTGCSIKAMAVLLEGLGVDAVGINCSLGPDEILPFAEELCNSTSLPVFVKPNAGLPDPATGMYDIDEKQFAESLLKYAEIGISAVGGCCGTSPDYIREVKKAFSDKKPVKHEFKNEPVVSTATKTVFIDDVRIIGERINPTGKKLMRQALLDGDMGYILKQAVTQADAGAHILDVNVGAPGVDEKTVLPKVIKQIQSVTDLPLQIDTSDAVALENALRVYNGKPIVNSVNGNKASMDAVLPLVKKYGAAVVGLTLDEGGIPPKAEERFKIAERILNEALSYGIPKEDVYIDCLTLTASAQQEAVMETLEALHRVSTELGLKTVLGVSNISFGLPNRELLNHSFLLMAMQNGLDLPIMNPNIDTMMDAVRAFRVLSNRDENSTEFIDAYKDIQTKTVVINPVAAEENSSSDMHPLIQAVKKGLSDEARNMTVQMLENTEAMTIVNTYLIPALDIVGELFEKGKLFLPQLLQSANAAQGAFDEIKKSLSKNNSSEGDSKSPIVIATVHGDIHDIGKNIVKVILENYGYRVIDLGRDVPAEEVVKATKESGAKLVGLSALMTTTLKSMEETIKLLHDEKCDCKIMVGGAVLTPDYAIEIGADFYAKDAKQSVDIAKQIIG